MNDIIKIYNLYRWSFKYPYELNRKEYILKFFISILLIFQPISFSYFITLLISSAIIELGKTSPNLYSLLDIIIIIFVIRVFASILKEVNYHISFAITEYSNSYISKYLTEKLSKLSEAKLEEPDLNDLYRRASGNMRPLVRFVERVTFELIPSFLELITYFILVININYLFVIISLIVTIPKLFFQNKFLFEIYNYAKNLRQQDRLSYSSYSEIQSPSKFFDINLLNIYNVFWDKYDIFQSKFLKNFIIIDKTGAKYRLFFNILQNLVLLYFLFDSFLKKVKIASDIGYIQFYFTTFNAFINNLDNVSNTYSQLKEQAYKVEEVKEFLDIEEYSNKLGIELDKLDKPPFISISNLTFKYPKSDKVILNDISFDIKPGEKIALVGENGAGKSTLIKILCKFYPEYIGKININGNELNKINANSWYRNVAVLFQEYSKFNSLTIKENVMVGDINAVMLDEGIWNALELATLDTWVKSLPNGLDQMLNPSYKEGIKPSSGQWQKLAIARFLYRNSPIIIFDEPTASIDAISEEKIFNNIFTHFKDKTVIIISHRFSTVRKADKILVLNSGKICEAGKHEELVSIENGIYRKSYEIQASGYNDF